MTETRWHTFFDSQCSYTGFPYKWKKQISRFVMTTEFHHFATLQVVNTMHSIVMFAVDFCPNYITPRKVIHSVCNSVMRRKKSKTRSMNKSETRFSAGKSQRPRLLVFCWKPGGRPSRSNGIWSFQTNTFTQATISTLVYALTCQLLFIIIISSSKSIKQKNLPVYYSETKLLPEASIILANINEKLYVWTF